MGEDANMNKDMRHDGKRIPANWKPNAMPPPPPRDVKEPPPRPQDNPSPDPPGENK